MQFLYKSASSLYKFNLFSYLQIHHLSTQNPKRIFNTLIEFTIPYLPPPIPQINPKHMISPHNYLNHQRTSFQFP